MPNRDRRPDVDSLRALIANGPLVQFARGAGLGRALLGLYYQPASVLGDCIAAGGPWEQRRTNAGRLDMIAAASSLPALTARSREPGLSVTFLSGGKYWYQTLFCFLSLHMRCETTIVPRIYDDGTFDEDIRSKILRVVPWAQIISAETINARLDKALPTSSFPTLRRRRLEYPHLRKLTDIHAGGSEWTLVLDSDMLFFRKPEELLQWSGSPGPLYMSDIETSYGYSPSLMRELAGTNVPEAINVGLYALDSSRVDWDRIEHACRRQLDCEGPMYLQEQALTALQLTWSGAVALPGSDYIVMPSLTEGRQPTAVLHHYVGASKRSYYQRGWRIVRGELAGAS